MEESKETVCFTFYVAIVYAGLGEMISYGLVERAYGDHSNAIVFLKVDPELDTRVPSEVSRTCTQAAPAR